MRETMLQKYYEPRGVAILEGPRIRSRVCHLVLRDVYDGRFRPACSAAEIGGNLMTITARPLCAACASIMRRRWPTFAISEHIMSRKDAHARLAAIKAKGGPR